MTNPTRRQRAIGALVGSAVGDALGAPFEFRPPGTYRRRFPEPVGDGGTEMVGGGSCDWEPGEWTDDTQMALCIAAALTRTGVGETLTEADLRDVWDRFQAWYAAGPPDVGISTAAVLGGGDPWDVAAQRFFARTGHAAGNGGLMRTTPAALRFAGKGTTATMDAGRRLALLTHGDPAAAEGSAILHELIRVGLDGDDPLDAIAATLALVDPVHRRVWAEHLAPGWAYDKTVMGNGAAWPTLGIAVWALRTTDTFADAVRAAIDTGDDTDTVACVTGALAGARYGVGSIPSRWTDHLHGRVPGNAPAATDLAGLERLALTLIMG